MNTLMRLNPDLVNYADRLDNLFAGFLRPVTQDNRNVVKSIKVDVSEDSNAYRVSALIPGVKKEDIHVSVEGNAVSIAAEVKRESEVKEGERVIHSERVYGSASRSFSLPQEIDETQVDAKYVDGVLTLVLPKKAQSSAKRITIQ